MTKVVKIDNLSKVIKKHAILKNINIEIDQGEIVGLIGRNGSGKSMLFKIICGLVLPTDGTIEVFGKNIMTSNTFPESLGALIEYPGFLPQFSGFKNLKSLADIRNEIGEKEIKEALGNVGLDINDKRHYRKYSLGMRQKLGIAAAIMEKPKLLVLDEPTNNLDSESVIEFRKLLIKINKEGATILLASHNLEDIESCCSRVYHIENGNISEVKGK